MSPKAVVALGGNALGKIPREQIEKIKEASTNIVDLIVNGYEVVLTHGNGPQVGMINLSFEESSKINKNIPKMNLSECIAMSQGYIGYHLQMKRLKNIAKKDILLREVCYQKFRQQLDLSKKESAGKGLFVLFLEQNLL